MLAFFYNQRNIIEHKHEHSRAQHIVHHDGVYLMLLPLPLLVGRFCAKVFREHLHAIANTGNSRWYAKAGTHTLS